MKATLSLIACVIGLIVAIGIVAYAVNYNKPVENAVPGWHYADLPDWAYAKLNAGDYTAIMLKPSDVPPAIAVKEYTPYWRYVNDSSIEIYASFWAEFMYLEVKR